MTTNTNFIYEVYNNVKIFDLTTNKTKKRVDSIIGITSPKILCLRKRTYNTYIYTCITYSISCTLESKLP